MVRSVFGQHGAIGGGRIQVRLSSEEVLALAADVPVGDATPADAARKLLKYAADAPLAASDIEAVRGIVHVQLSRLVRDVPDAPAGTAEEQGRFYSDWLRGGTSEAERLKEHPKLMMYSPKAAQPSPPL